MRGKVNYVNLSDGELVSSYSQGDNLAFAEIYQRYWMQLLNHARRMLRDEALAEDVVQDVFTKLLEKLKQMQVSDSLAGILYYLVRNAVISHIRREKVELNYVEYAKVYENFIANPPDTELIKKELNTALDKEIDLFPPKLREIFLLRRLELSNREIAEKQDISEYTVKNQIKIGLKTLRRKLTLLMQVFVNMIIFLS
uniref:RNA polymerase sigma factor n=1 Tax=Pedobacter schmidteae TaxID=2201271 RepID=UPI000EAE0DC8|nr:sigma-70 family RNA polymerase sigma factor [Pedobacter schmidteae]